MRGGALPPDFAGVARDNIEVVRNQEIVPHHDGAAHAARLHESAELGARPAKPDDLKIVEGIGPKIEKLLNGRGIWTFAQLAACTADWIKSALNEAGPNFAIHEPKTWPHQSDLAAKGKWQELEVLQKQLTGGR